MFCQDLKKLTDIKLKCISDACDCDSFYPRGGISLTSILSDDICPFLLYLCFPYCETFHAGGSFPWMKDRNTVIIQCPYMKGAVEMEIRRRIVKNNVEIYGLIINVKGECIWGCKEGMKVEFDLAPIKNMCLKAYHCLFPHLLSLVLIENDSPAIQVQCPKSGGTVFEVVKDKSKLSINI